DSPEREKRERKEDAARFGTLRLAARERTLMALLQAGTPCPLCGRPMRDGDDTIGFTFLNSRKPLLMPFDDGVVHRHCISTSQHRDEFVAAWNAEAGHMELIVTSSGEVRDAVPARPLFGSRG